MARCPGIGLAALRLVGTQYTRMGGEEAVPAELRNTLIEPFFVPRISCMGSQASSAPAIG